MGVKSIDGAERGDTCTELPLLVDTAGGKRGVSRGRVNGEAEVEVSWTTYKSGCR